MTGPVAAVLLAGGAGRRIGGDKPFRPLGGAPLAAWPLSVLAARPGPLAIAAGPDPDPRWHTLAPAARLIADVADASGPAAGLAAGLRFAAGQPGGALPLLVAPADTPFLPPTLLDVLASHAGGAEAAIAKAHGRPSPVVALYRPGVAAPLAALFAEDPAPSLQALLGRIRWRAVPVQAAPPFAAAGADPLFNVNTPEDLAAAEAILRRAGSGS